MDDTLKRLLDAEVRAEALVDEAKAQAEQMARQALEDARGREQEFHDRTPEIRNAMLEKARERASKELDALQNRQEAHAAEIRAAAEAHRRDAIDAAVGLIIETDGGDGAPVAEPDEP